MAELLDTQELTITTERSLNNFTVSVPDDKTKAPFVQAVFHNVYSDGSGNYIKSAPADRMIVSMGRLNELLPTGVLVDFPSVYAEIRDLFHSEYKYRVANGISLI